MSNEKPRWKLLKQKVTGVHIDTKKRTILYDPDYYWIRFETKDLIHIYGHEEKKREDPKEAPKEESILIA